jgi:hypothetical protein
MNLYFDRLCVLQDRQPATHADSEIRGLQPDLFVPFFHLEASQLGQLVRSLIPAAHCAVDKSGIFTDY